MAVVIATVRLNSLSGVSFKEVEVDGVRERVVVVDSTPGSEMLAGVEAEQQVELEVQTDGTHQHLAVVNVRKVLTHPFYANVQIFLPMAEKQDDVVLIAQLVVWGVIRKEHEKVKRALIEAAERTGLPLDSPIMSTALARLNWKIPEAVAA